MENVALFLEYEFVDIGCFVFVWLLRCLSILCDSRVVSMPVNQGGFSFTA